MNGAWTIDGTHDDKNSMEISNALNHKNICSVKCIPLYNNDMPCVRVLVLYVAPNNNN